MKKIYVTNGKWNYERIPGDDAFSYRGVGGFFPVKNLSRGYHGLLKQWLDNRAINGKNCLLISENDVSKRQFEDNYSDIEFKTLDHYPEMNENIDLKYNLCEYWNHDDIETIGKFDIILCQATLEHLYDPYTAIKNLKNVLNVSGALMLHTHVPGMKYHPYPRDYVRFYPDWFLDIEKFMGKIKLTELVVVDVHIFAEYVKIP